MVQVHIHEQGLEQGTVGALELEQNMVEVLVQELGFQLVEKKEELEEEGMALVGEDRALMALVGEDMPLVA